ncbi:MAG: hypothetical protein KDK70_00930 [Myxococcales bacterium]|nr:hypothetical protein [Myxococcales bacterium]
MTRTTGHEAEARLRAEIEELREALTPERGQALCRALVATVMGDHVSTTVLDALATALWASFRQLVEESKLSPELLTIILHETNKTTEETPHLEPTVSRWHRRRGGGPRGIVIHDDFDEPLSEFDGD